MVSFNDAGTEAEALSEQDDYGYEFGRGRTRYTKCYYCGKRFPLREISAHARREHYDESTKYTDCWHCGRRFPLREIRGHARVCRAEAAEPVAECSCSAYSEDRGGGYFELMLEPDPDCPEHGAGISDGGER